MNTAFNIKTDLYDAIAFGRELQSGSSPLSLFKKTIKSANAKQKEMYQSGVTVVELVKMRADFLDEMLCQAWRFQVKCADDLMLAAVGGYGRGELHPGSDIDIAIVTEEELTDSQKTCIEGFLMFLWDIGLEIGHSVRTLQQCVDEAAADITVITNITEARYLDGRKDLFDTMKESTSPEHIWSNEAYFSAKLEEQRIRHGKFDDTAHKLEPNIKEGPGGLRDIQMVGWVAKRYFGADHLRELVEHKFLTEEEYYTLDAGQTFLWHIRYALHMISGRREDRLQFEHQRTVAEEFGYTDNEQRQLGVEQFMKMYYQTVNELSRLNEMLLQLFQEAILHRNQLHEIKPLNRRFHIRNNFIEVRNDQIFMIYPFAMLEIFLLMQQNPEIKGVRASTIRLIRNHLHLIDKNFRRDIRARSLVMEILRQTRSVGPELERMHRYGIIDAYIPAYAAVSGLMQFDMYHIYTVDEHTLMVMRNLRRFDVEKFAHEFPYCSTVMAQIPKPELLYLSGLFHDIGKGRGGNHAVLGAEDALVFCKDHGLSTFDSNLVAWLVRSHLVMSHTINKKDICDPDVIHEFASFVGDTLHLNHLYLLTVADIRGTNPNLWNNWKATLLHDLHLNTTRALRRGLENPIDKQERLLTTQGECLAKLCCSNASKDEIVSLFESLGEDYFLRHQPEEIIWQVDAILKSSKEDMPIVLVQPETARGGTEVFVYTPDRDYVFAVTTQILDQMGLNILDARIINTTDNYTLDTYVVLDAASNQNLTDPEMIERLISTLREELSSTQVLKTKVNRRPSRQLKQFSIPPEVSFHQDPDKNRTVMEVSATDQPGFLSCVGMAMKFCGARLQNARIATIGARVEDIFYITDMDNAPIHDPVKFECLRNTIVDILTSSD